MIFRYVKKNWQKVWIRRAKKARMMALRQRKR